MRGFDLSLSGFWRSFLVIVLLVPPFLIAILAERKLILTNPELPAGEFNDAVYLLSQSIGFGLDWVILPVLLAFLARPLNLGQAYVPFIVARNWTTLIAVIPYTIPALLYAIGIISASAMLLLSFVAMLIVIRYRYMVARIALDATVGLAIGIVMLDFLISLVIGTAITRLTGF
ncbi:hypothetical protein HPQ64_00250 [Rhizobiales bacterium]|nr:hypothetical protein [Hongsoonwoonella zoysiae]